MEVDYIVEEKITLCQSFHFRKILDWFQMTACKPTTVPMTLGVANFLLPYEENADNRTIKWYQSAIGFFIWPAVHTRPDIVYSMGVLIRHCSNLGPTNCNLLV